MTPEARYQSALALYENSQLAQAAEEFELVLERQDGGCEALGELYLLEPRA